MRMKRCAARYSSPDMVLGILEPHCLLVSILTCNCRFIVSTCTCNPAGKAAARSMLALVQPKRCRHFLRWICCISVNTHPLLSGGGGLRVSHICPDCRKAAFQTMFPTIPCIMSDTFTYLRLINVLGAHPWSWQPSVQRGRFSGCPC